VANSTASTIARVGHTATLLPSNDVLVVGGYSSDRLTASAELYHPATSLWKSIGDLNVPRADHTASLLMNGNVLVTGGNDSNGVTKSVEIYDPLSQWNPTGDMIFARASHTATLLLTGHILVTGGKGSTGSIASAELYNPIMPIMGWRLTGDLNIARSGHTATLLKNGNVLVVGGYGGGGILASAEIYHIDDPATGQGHWVDASDGLHVARAGHSATLLENGNGDVLIAGGYRSGGILASAEIYHIDDPATGQGHWVDASDGLHVARMGHSATLLLDNTVFVAGGDSADGPLTSSELYDTKTGQWIPTGSLSVPRSFHTATLLQDGSLLITGGISLRSELVPAERVTPGVQATLEWNRVSDPTVLGYKVYYGTTSNSYQGAVILDRETKYLFGNLPKGTMYYFAVTSFNGIGESCSSNEVSKFIP